MYYNHLQFKPHLASKRCEQYISRVGRGVCRVHLQTLIAAEPLQLQWGFLQLQARFCNCRHIRSFGVFAMERQHCSSSQVPICRCCNCKGGKRVRKVKKTGKVLQSGPPRSIIPLSPPRGKLAVGQLVHGAFVYVVSVVFRLNEHNALAAERGEAFARSGLVDFDQPVQRRVVARHLACAAPSPTQEGLITKSLHGTREKLLMPPAQVIVTHRPG